MRCPSQSAAGLSAHIGSKLLHRAYKSAATRASTDMGGDGMALSFVKRTGRGWELDVGGMMLGRHDMSPKQGGASGYRQPQARFDRRYLTMRLRQARFDAATNRGRKVASVSVLRLPSAQASSVELMRFPALKAASVRLRTPSARTSAAI